jgi:hypothetical protein
MSKHVPAFESLELLQVLFTALLLLPTLVITSPFLISLVTCKGCKSVLRKMWWPDRLKVASA